MDGAAGAVFKEIAAWPEYGQDADSSALHQRIEVTKMRHHPKTSQIAGLRSGFCVRRPQSLIGVN